MPYRTLQHKCGVTEQKSPLVKGIAESAGESIYCGAVVISGRDILLRSKARHLLCHICSRCLHYLQKGDFALGGIVEREEHSPLRKERRCHKPLLQLQQGIGIICKEPAKKRCIHKGPQRRLGSGNVAHQDSIAWNCLI